MPAKKPASTGRLSRISCIRRSVDVGAEILFADLLVLAVRANGVDRSVELVDQLLLARTHGNRDLVLLVEGIADLLAAGAVLGREEGTHDADVADCGIHTARPDVEVKLFLRGIELQLRLLELIRHVVGTDRAALGADHLAGKS